MFNVRYENNSWDVWETTLDKDKRCSGWQTGRDRFILESIWCMKHCRVLRDFIDSTTMVEDYSWFSWTLGSNKLCGEEFECLFDITFNDWKLTSLSWRCQMEVLGRLLLLSLHKIIHLFIVIYSRNRWDMRRQW